MISEAGYRENLLFAIEQYSFCVDGNEEIRQSFLQLVKNSPQAANRDSFPAHLTASGWVVDKRNAACLLIFHKKLGMWVQAGGHADGKFDLVGVAKREVFEETGVSVCAPFGESIFDLDVHDIPGGPTTPPHQHFDVRYLFTAENGVELTPNHEIHEARWIPIDEVEHFTQEPSIIRMRDRGKKLLALDKTL